MGKRRRFRIRIILYLYISYYGKILQNLKHKQSEIFYEIFLKYPNNRENLEYLQKLYAETKNNSENAFSISLFTD